MNVPSKKMEPTNFWGYAKLNKGETSVTRIPRA